MVAFVDVTVVEPTLVVQHLEFVVLQEGYISVVMTRVHHPACPFVGAACGWFANGLDRLTREDRARTVSDGLTRADGVHVAAVVTTTCFRY